MCVSPIYIKNKSKGLHSVPDKIFNKDIGDISFLFDDKNSLAVPCGKCTECKEARLNHYLDPCIYYSKDYFPFLLSCSIKEKFIKYLYGVSYADTSYVNRFFRNLVINGVIPNDYHYVGVTERGSKRGRPHFHFILFIPKSFVISKVGKLNRSDEFYVTEFARKYVKLFWQSYSVNVGTRKNPFYVQICDYVVRGNKRSFSLDGISGRMDKALYYTLKYNFKQSDYVLIPDEIFGTNLAKQFYNTVRNKILMSRSFHKWIYDFIDSDVCVWHYSDLFDMVYPHIRLPNVFKPISFRSFRKICDLSDFIHIKKHFSSKDYNLISDLQRIQNSDFKAYKEDVYYKNKIKFDDSFDF